MMIPLDKNDTYQKMDSLKKDLEKQIDVIDQNIKFLIKEFDKFFKKVK